MFHSSMPRLAEMLAVLCKPGEKNVNFKVVITVKKKVLSSNDLFLFPVPPAIGAAIDYKGR